MPLAEIFPTVPPNFPPFVPLLLSDGPQAHPFSHKGASYDTEDDELDLLIDALEPEPAEVIPAGDDIFLRRSVQTGKIVGATIANYSLWRPGRLPVRDLDSELIDVYAHIVRYLEVMKQKKPALT